MTEHLSDQATGLNKKGITFETILDPALPSKIVGDQQKIEQVIGNLLSNAFKFTPHGSIQFKIQRAVGQLDNATPDNLIVTVSDTGIGIPVHAQSYIFDAFRQVDGTTSRRFGGTGLGLSITQNLVALMGGTIRFTSEPYHGTTFIVTLPLQELEHEKVAHA